MTAGSARQVPGTTDGDGGGTRSNQAADALPTCSDSQSSTGGGGGPGGAAGGGSLGQVSGFEFQWRKLLEMNKTT